MAAGGGGGRTWIAILVGGALVVLVAMGLEAAEALPRWLHATLLGLGGLGVVFGSCEAIIKSVEGLSSRLRLNAFVAGQLAGLAGNLPELVMLGFVLAAAPRVGFVVTLFTLHVGAATFGVYSGVLPRDAEGHASLPVPLVKLATDLYACACGVFFAMGAIMVLMKVFDAGTHQGEALSAADLYVIGGVLLVVEVIAVVELVRRFRGAPKPDAKTAGSGEPAPPSFGSIGGYLALGTAGSILGGHAVGDFAGILVGGLTEAGYSEMIGALIISIFAVAGVLAMLVTAHARGAYDIALAAASGQITQVPFVVMPFALILLAAFGQTGVIPLTPHGGVLPIDLETTSVVFLAVPPMLILWKAVQDDGKVNWVETAAMVAVFGLTIYFLAVHG